MDNNQRVTLSAERRVILIFVMSALLSIVLVGGGLRYALQRTALAQCRTSLESLTGVLARQCDSEIADARQDLEFLSKTPAFQQLPYVDRIDRSINGIPENAEAEKRQILAQLMKKADRFSVLYMLPPNGDLYLVHPFQTQLALKKSSLSDRPYYQEAVRTGKTVVSDSFVGADGILAVAILVPIFAESGEVTGYLGGAFHLSRLSQLVSKEKIKPFDVGFIVDRQGWLIAHTDTDLLRENIRERFKDHPLVRGFSSTEGGTPEEERGAVFLDDCVDPVDAKHYLAAFATLRSGWGLGLMRERTLVIAEVRPVIWGITCFTGLLLAVISGLAVVVAQRIGRNWHNTERALYASEAALRESNEYLEKASAELERSNKELEQFAYVASHDLQEPLRMVSSYSQLLAERYEGQLDEKAKKYIEYAVDGAIRMQRLINDLLAYSRVGTRGNPIESTDAHSGLGEAIRNLAAMIEESKAIITNEELPMVRADASQLVQVFQNLLSNGIKFRGEDFPRVHVSVRDGGREWVFSVKDNGIGIDPQYADRVFVIFQRLHTRQEYPGTGIGLAVCRRIVERHAGKIWFESEPGKGSTFFFTIPK
jgi:signal transduction histidine kinase